MNEDLADLCKHSASKTMVDVRGRRPRAPLASSLKFPQLWSINGRSFSDERMC